MSTQPLYTEAVDKTQDLFSNVTEMWTQGFQKMLSGNVPSTPLPSLDPAALIDPVFDGAQRLLGTNPFAERLLEINRDYAKNLMDVMLSVQGIVREHTEALTEAVRDQVGATAEVVKEQTGKVKQATHEQAAEAERAAKRAARQAEKAARDAAGEAYAEFTKVELQDELASRDLPKSGNVDELRERLIDDDLGTTAV